MTFIESCSPHTLRAYKIDLAQVFGHEISSLEASPTRPPVLSDQSTQALLEAVRSGQSRWAPLKPGSRNRKAATMKSFLGWLHSEGLSPRDLASLIHAPKVPSRLPKHISVDEATALLRYLETETQRDPRKLPSFALVCLLYGGGLRVSEACELRTKNVDLTSGTCRVLGKGSKERIVTLPPMALAVIRQLMEVRGPKSVYVFGNDALDTRTAYEMVRTAGAAAGLLRPLHPHALRHSYATHLLRSGANLRVLQALLGHATLQATSRYTHIGIDQLARTLENHHPLGEANAKSKRAKDHDT